MCALDGSCWIVVSCLILNEGVWWDGCVEQINCDLWIRNKLFFREAMKVALFQIQRSSFELWTTKYLTSNSSINNQNETTIKPLLLPPSHQVNSSYWKTVSELAKSKPEPSSFHNVCGAKLIGIKQINDKSPQLQPLLSWLFNLTWQLGANWKSIEIEVNFSSENYLSIVATAFDCENHTLSSVRPFPRSRTFSSVCYLFKILIE